MHDAPWCRRLVLLALVLPAASLAPRYFVKTETFAKPFPVVKPHLDAHKEWFFIKLVSNWSSATKSGFAQSPRCFALTISSIAAPSAMERSPRRIIESGLAQRVRGLRADGLSVTSGHRVDGEGKPGGGGMMFFQAADYAAASDLVARDPLIANDCVDWRLNEWIADVGGIDLC